MKRLKAGSIPALLSALALCYAPGLSAQDAAPAPSDLPAAAAPAAPAETPAVAAPETPAAPAAPAATGRRRPVQVEGKKLALRVLSRPFSKIYKESNEQSAVVQDNVPAFQPFYVYTRPEASDIGAGGWYEVGGDTRGTVVGWMKADDVMEWKQAMCLSYTHPQGRDPVLMFGKVDPLKTAVAAAPDARAKDVDGWYATIDSKKIPKDFPVLSMEPKRAVHIDIQEQFYLLPIVGFEPAEIDGREARLLKLAAATAAGRGASTVQDTNFLAQAVTDTDAKSQKLKELKIQIVYAIDLTTSMQPYIDATVAAVKKTSEALAQDADLAKNLTFGLWGYRDSEEIPGLEFNTKNFTPQLQAATDFANTLGGVKAATVGSQGFDEDTFSGVDKALRETAWDPEALRFIVLIGDAPGHEAGHKWNKSGQTEDTLRQFADDNKVGIYCVHIVNDDPNVASFNEKAEVQFKKLGQNPGAEAGGGAYQAIPAKDLARFQDVSDTLVGIFKQTVADARKKADVSTVMGPATASAEPPAGQEPASDIEKAVEKKDAKAETTARAGAMISAALVDWLGKEEEVQAPRDITAWVIDKDLKDPAKQALEVRVLVNKSQLDSLNTVLKEIVAAGRRGQIAGEDFFTALQSTSATLSVTPEQIKQAKILANTGLIPDFLKDLPYKSQIMSMSDEVWAGWSQDQQDEFLNNVDAKIKFYEATHNQTTGWVKLNEGDDDNEAVHPIPLDMLP